MPRFPLFTEIACGISPSRKAEFKTVLDQSRWDDATTLQNEFCFRAQENGADLQHPLAGRESERNTGSLAKDLHELRIRQRIRGRDVDDARDFLVIDQPAGGCDEILVVDPRHELPPITSASAEAVPNEAQ